MSNSDKTSSKRGRGKSLSTTLPSMGKESLKKIIDGFFIKGETEISSNEIAVITDIHKDSVSKQMKFLLSIGLLEKHGRLYKLSTKGSDYAKFIGWKQQNEASRILKELLTSSDEITKFIQSVRLTKKPITKDEARNKYGMIAKLPTNRSDLITGIDTVIALLLEAEIFKETEDGLISFNTDINEVDEQTPLVVTEKPDEVLKQIGEWRGSQKHLIEDYPSDLKINFNINFDITQDMDPKWVGEIIKRIKEEWYQNLDSDEINEETHEDHENKNEEEIEKKTD